MKDTATWNQYRAERELKVAMCEQTYYNLNGCRPTAGELTEWLGAEYLLDIMRMRNRGLLHTGPACA